MIKFLNITNLISALFLIVLFIFHYEKIHNIMLYVFMLSYIIGYALEKRWKSFTWTKCSWYFLPFIFLFLLMLLWMPFEERQDYTLKMMEYKLALLGFGIVGILGLNKYHKLKYYIITICLTTFCASMYVLLKTFWAEGINPNFLDQLVNVRTEINYHMPFNYYLNISNVLAFYVLYKNRTSKKVKAFYIASLLVNYIILFCTEGRCGSITGIVILLIPLLMWGMKHKKMSFALLLGIVGSVIFIFSHNDRWKSTEVSDSPRMYIWRNTADLIKEQPIGYGAGDALDRFSNKIMSDTVFSRTCAGDPIFLVIEQNRLVRIHSHNIFLQSALEFGFIGFAVALLLYIVPFVVSAHFPYRERLAFIFLTLVLLIQTMTDNITCVPIEPYLLIMTALLYHAKKMSDENLEKEVIQR